MLIAKILIYLLSLVGLGTTLFFFGTYLTVSATGVVIGLVLGAAYLAALLWFISLSPMSPRFKRGRRRGGTFEWVICALLCGSGGAMIISAPSAMVLLQSASDMGWFSLAAGLAGGYPEEAAKAVIIALILLAFTQLNRPWHGLIVGAVVGTGFEVFENVLYGATGALLDPTSDAIGAVTVWLFRVFVGIGIHAVFAAIAGWGIGWALHNGSVWPALGWTFVAVALHFGWNLIADPAVFAIKNGMIMVVMYTLIIVLVRRGNAMARDFQRTGIAPAPKGWVAVAYPAKTAAVSD